LGTQRENMDDCRIKGRRRTVVGEQQARDLRGQKSWRRFSNQEEARLLEAWKAGNTLVQLAQAESVPILTIFRAVHRAEERREGILPAERRRPPVANPKQVQIVRSLARAGKSIRAIARVVELGPWLVHSVLKERGPYAGNATHPGGSEDYLHRVDSAPGNRSQEISIP
jgi:hypothetical protein